MKKLSADFWLCAIASVLWLAGAVFSAFVFPTPISVIGSVVLSVFFAARAATYLPGREER